MDNLQWHWLIANVFLNAVFIDIMYRFIVSFFSFTRTQYFYSIFQNFHFINRMRFQSFWNIGKTIKIMAKLFLNQNHMAQRTIDIRAACTLLWSMYIIWKIFAPVLDFIWNSTQVCCLSLNAGNENTEPESYIAFFEVRITFAAIVRLSCRLQNDNRCHIDFSTPCCVRSIAMAMVSSNSSCDEKQTLIHYINICHSGRNKNTVLRVL